MKLLSKKSTTTYRFGSKYDVAMGDAIGQSFDYYEVDCCEGVVSDIRHLHVTPGRGIGSTAIVKESRLKFEISYPELRLERDIDRIIFEAENATSTRDADDDTCSKQYGNYGFTLPWSVCLPSDVWDGDMPPSLYESSGLTPEEARQLMVEVYSNSIKIPSKTGQALNSGPVYAYITVFRAGFSPSPTGRYHWCVQCKSVSLDGYESSFRDARDACIAAAHTSALH